MWTQKRHQPKAKANCSKTEHFCQFVNKLLTFWEDRRGQYQKPCHDGFSQMRLESARWPRVLAESWRIFIYSDRSASFLRRLPTYRLRLIALVVLLHAVLVALYGFGTHLGAAQPVFLLGAAGGALAIAGLAANWSRPAFAVHFWNGCLLVSLTAVGLCLLRDHQTPHCSIALAAIAVSQRLPSSRRDLALALGIFGLALPVAGVQAAVLGLDVLHEGMPLLFNVAVAVIALLSLEKFVRHPKLRAIFRDTPDGRLFRTQLKLWLVVALVFPVVLRLDDGGQQRFVPLYIVGVLLLFAVQIVSFANRYARLLDRARRAQAQLLQDLARDDLTGAASRRAAVHAFYEMSGEHRLAVVLLDLDYFKAVNDTYGHDTGDEVLKRVVKALKRELAPGDVLGRWGGEEFLVLTRYSSKKALLEKTERFGDAIRSVHVHPEHSYPLTASIGVRVVYPDDDLDLEDHVSAADHAMYEAKASGRNRVVLSLKEQAERDGNPA